MNGFQAPEGTESYEEPDDEGEEQMWYDIASI